jgi:hypothetical protein
MHRLLEKIFIRNRDGLDLSGNSRVIRIDTEEMLNHGTVPALHPAGVSVLSVIEGRLMQSMFNDCHSIVYDDASLDQMIRLLTYFREHRELPWGELEGICVDGCNGWKLRVQSNHPFYRVL